MGVDVGVSDFNLDRDIPVARFLREASGENLAWESHILPGTDPAQLGNLDLATVKLEGFTLDGEGRVRSFLALEPGVADFAGSLLNATEEVGEGGPKVRQRLVDDSPRQLGHPRELNGFDGVQLPVELNPGWSIPGFILGLPQAQSPVERKAGRACATVEKRGLHVIGVNPDALAENHAPISLRTRRRSSSEIDTSRRFASSRSHARSGGSKWTLMPWTGCLFFGAAMYINIARLNIEVKYQFDGVLVNSHQPVVIIDEQKVRRRV